MKNDNFKSYKQRHYPTFPHVGVGILLIRDKKLLLIKRKYDPDAGYWSIPGGHVDLGERVQDAAVREALEETGYKTRVTSLAGIINKIVQDDKGRVEYHYVIIYYFVEQIEGRLDRPPVAATDALDARFVPFDELKKYKLTKSLVALLKQLKIGF